MSLPDTTAIAQADIATGSDLERTLSGRLEIFEMTQAAEEAVLRPGEVGAWPHDLRAACAARIAALNGDMALRDRYLAGAGAAADLADPSSDGSDREMQAVLAFMDKVAADTRAVEKADIDALKEAGVADADIVRLAELNAFVSYQIRVIAGLRLMKRSRP
ncbi:hypothetical protein P1J78_22655 [Psychromarinibacter sp. C21-152]|uniref:CMD domain protein, Avi_7170 family n=1 Tax=Psychromarinibacter sediminicola TaxID=3033385 RepID=A0AAE3TCE0_9RHOB|nr:hypothetical protein [Psychromarinibacter sediminicola]MDF0603535.1 hypothetical protein [Psychromarinibacter sediminicola]